MGEYRELYAALGEYVQQSLRPVSRAPAEHQEFILQHQDAYSTTYAHIGTDGDVTLIIALRASVSESQFPAVGTERFFEIQQRLLNAPHPNVMPFSVCNFETPMPMLVMSKGAARIPGRRSTEVNHQLSMAREVTDAVKHIHGCGAVHGNLHPDNVLCDAAGGAHVINVGMHILFNKPPSNLYAGHWRWMPREMLSLDSDANSHAVIWPNEKTDIYTLGLLLRWVFTGKIPFDRYHEGPPGPLIKELSKPHAARDLLAQDCLRDDVKALIQACIDHDPARRLPASDVLERLEALN